MVTNSIDPVHPAADATLRDRTLSGIGWSAASQGAQQLLRFVLMIVLARLLRPSDFGLVGMALVFTGFASILHDAGFSSALIQRQRVDEIHLSSVFWANVVAGLLLSLMFGLGAPLVAAFYGEPRLTAIIAVSGLSFVLGSFGLVHAALLKKTLRFRDLAFVESLAVGISGIASIVMAFAGLGAWTLVWQTLIYGAARSILLWIRSEWRPRTGISWGALADLADFSLNLTGFSVFRYWVRNGDNLIIGKFLGASALGVYTRAYALMLFPINQITNTIGRVMFPALSLIQDDTPRIKRAFLHANRSIALITVPMMVGLLVTAEPFVLVLLGPKWAGVTPVLRLLCAVGISQPMTSTTGWLFTACGRTRAQFIWGVTGGVVSIAAFLIGVRWGVSGVAAAYLVRTYLLWYPAIAYPAKFVGLSFREYIANLWPVFGAAAVMALVMLSALALLPSALGPGLSLCLLVALGGATYFAVLMLGGVKAFQEVVDLVRKARMRFAAIS